MLSDFFHISLLGNRIWVDKPKVQFVCKYDAFLCINISNVLLFMLMADPKGLAWCKTKNICKCSISPGQNVCLWQHQGFGMSSRSCMIQKAAIHVINIWS
ncbi:unnamed protein product [Musa textilis]